MRLFVIVCWLVVAGSLVSCNKNKVQIRFCPPISSSYKLNYALDGRFFVQFLGNKDTSSIASNLEAKLFFDSTAKDNRTFVLTYSNALLPEIHSSKQNSGSIQMYSGIKNLIESLQFKGNFNKQGKAMVQPNDSLSQRLAKSFQNDSMPEILRKKLSDMLQLFAGHEMLSGMLNQAFYVLPNKMVAVGDRWHHETNMQSFVSMTIDNEFTLKKIENGLAEFAVLSNIRPANNVLMMQGLGMAAPPMLGTDNISGNFDFMGLDLKVTFTGEQKGTIWVRLKDGITEKSQLHQQIDGKVEAGPIAVPIIFNLKTNFSTLPIEKM